jgi:hypothetical protein
MTTELDRVNARRALAHLLIARDLLKRARATNAVARVRAAITSTGAVTRDGLGLQP